MVRILWKWIVAGAVLAAGGWAEAMDFGISGGMPSLMVQQKDYVTVPTDHAISGGVSINPASQTGLDLSFDLGYLDIFSHSAWWASGQHDADLRDMSANLIPRYSFEMSDVITPYVGVVLGVHQVTLSSVAGVSGDPAPVLNDYRFLTGYVAGIGWSLGTAFGLFGEARDTQLPDVGYAQSRVVTYSIGFLLKFVE